MQGYIKDHRKELESSIWMMPPLYHRVWQYLKYTVNHKENTIPMKDGTNQVIKKGQRIYSKRGIAQAVGWYEGRVWKEPNPKTIDVILKWLEKQNMIQIKSKRGNNGYTLITLINWDLYQSNEETGNNERTFEESLSNLSTDKNNNDKECLKNDKEISSRHKYEICDMEMAQLLFQRMRENNPTAKQPNFEAWANEVRLMRERDNRTIEQIKYLINWCQNDSFWKTNILSISKLRKQWDQLVLKCKQDKERKNKKIPQKTVRKEDFDLSDD